MTGRGREPESSAPGGHAAERLKDFLQQRFEDDVDVQSEVGPDNDDSGDQPESLDQPKSDDS
jgi:hypothetical protein